MAGASGYRMNPGAAYASVIKTVSDELRKLGERAVVIAKEEAAKTVYGYGPGTPEWRDRLVDSLHVLSVKTEGNEAVVEFGAELTPGTPEWMGALIVTYGTGSRASTDGGIGGPIMSRPGEIVWRGDLSRGPSLAETSENLPDMFNQEGNMWLENTMKRMEPEVRDFEARLGTKILETIAGEIRG